MQEQLERAWRINFARRHMMKAARGFAEAGNAAKAAEYLAAIEKQEREGWPAIT